MELVSDILLRGEDILIESLLGMLGGDSSLKFKDHEPPDQCLRLGCYIVKELEIC